MLYPLCAGAGCGKLGHGADDRSFPGSPGHGDHDHRLVWTECHVGHRTAGRDGEHHRGCGIYRLHPAMGSDTAGIAFYLGAVPCDDPNGVQPFFQALHCDGYRACALGQLFIFPATPF